MEVEEEEDERRANEEEVEEEEDESGRRRAIATMKTMTTALMVMSMTKPLRWVMTTQFPTL